MTKFTVSVTERVTVVYPSVEIEADSYEEARDIAASMREEGHLGNPHDHESVDDVEIDCYPA